MLSCKTFFQTYVSPKMKTLVIVLTPLLLLPLIFNGAVRTLLATTNSRKNKIIIV